MNTLKVEKRNMQTKAKKLRREGFVTGNVFGKEIEGSIPVQITRKAAEDLLKAHRKGSQLMLDVDGKNIDVLIKEIDYNASKRQIMEIDFQELVKGEMVNSVAEVILLNHDKITQGIVEFDLEEIAYKATPDALVETIEIDLDNRKVGEEIRVRDLPIASNEKVHVLTNLDESVVRIVEPHNNAVDDEDAEEEDAE